VDKGILKPEFWKVRLARANSMREPHRAVYECTLEQWKNIENEHRKVLRQTVMSDWSVLDIGCGYGRLLEILPTSWKGEYLGVDASPDFIEMAEIDFYCYDFICSRIEEITVPAVPFDLAIMISFRAMVVGNLGQAAWENIEKLLPLLAKRVLYLEYSAEEGSSQFVEHQY